MATKKKETLGWGFEYGGFLHGDVFSGRSAAREWADDYPAAKIVRVKVQKYAPKKK